MMAENWINRELAGGEHSGIGGWNRRKWNRSGIGGWNRGKCNESGIGSGVGVE